MSRLEVIQFPCLNDNYGIIIHDKLSQKTVAIDAPEQQAIEKILKENNWHLNAIWITHHHHDHTQANEGLQKRYNCDIYGPKKEVKQIYGVTHTLDHQSEISIGQHDFTIIETAGHTHGHISYYCSQQNILFCGDALFVLGCGRMFEGTAHDMWIGLDRLRQLPDETWFYCGHEYSAANADFARALNPENTLLEHYAREIHDKTAQSYPCLPAKLGNEKKCNPFLRPEDIHIQKRLSVVGEKNDRIFAAIRKAKDNF